MTGSEMGGMVNGFLMIIAAFLSFVFSVIALICALLGFGTATLVLGAIAGVLGLCSFGCYRLVKLAEARYYAGRKEFEEQQKKQEEQRKKDAELPKTNENTEK